MDDTLFNSPEFFTDPYGVYSQLRQGTPVQRMELGGLPMWLITGYEAVRRTLTDHRFVKEPPHWPVPLEQIDPGLGSINTFVGKHLLYSDPPRHTRLRKLVGQSFTPGRVAGLEPTIRSIVDGLLRRIERLPEADLIGGYAVPIAVGVICELLGIPLEEREDFRRWSLTLVTADPPGVPAAEHAAVRQASLTHLTDYLTALIARRRTRPAGDLLSGLVQARDGDDGRLEESELVAMALLLLIAGHETTVNLIGNGMLSLLTHPEQARLLRRQPDLLPAAVEEIARFEGSIMLASLYLTAEPVELDGVLIPAGEVVVAVLGAADRDPARFADPDRFDVTRTATPHLAFGAGIHYCLGAPLARLEGRIAIGELLARFPDLALAVPPEEVRWNTSFSNRGLRALPVSPHGHTGTPAPGVTEASATGSIR